MFQLSLMKFTFQLVQSCFVIAQYIVRHRTNILIKLSSRLAKLLILELVEQYLPELGILTEHSQKKKHQMIVLKRNRVIIFRHTIFLGNY